MGKRNILNTRGGRGRVRTRCETDIGREVRRETDIQSDI